MNLKIINIIFKARQEKARQLAMEIHAYLAGRNITGILTQGAEKNLEQADLYIILGGDGTILGAGRKLAGKNKPILGINFGRVGFLAGVASCDWQIALEKTLAGDMPERKCLALQWQLNRANATPHSGTAVNEAVIAHGKMARLMQLNIAVDNTPIGPLRCDGVMVCSPLGSSGYNSSAGGSIIYPALNAISLTPICAFERNFTPVVLPSSTQIKISPTTYNSETYLTIDGQEGYKLQAGDEVVITSLPNALIFLGFKEQFFKKLTSSHNSGY